MFQFFKCVHVFKYVRVYVYMHAYVTYLSVYGCVHVLVGRCLGMWGYIFLPVSSIPYNKNRVISKSLHSHKCYENQKLGGAKIDYGYIYSSELNMPRTVLCS